MPELAGGFLLIVAVAIVVGVLISAAFLTWAAGMVGIANRSFGKAIGITLLGGLASAVVNLIVAGLPVVSLLLGFVVYALVAMPIFDTTFGKAFGATLIAWLLSLVVVGGGLLLFLAAGVSLAALS
jgi:hypothetical protein